MFYEGGYARLRRNSLGFHRIHTPTRPFAGRVNEEDKDIRFHHAFLHVQAFGNNLHSDGASQSPIICWRMLLWRVCGPRAPWTRCLRFARLNCYSSTCETMQRKCSVWKCARHGNEKIKNTREENEEQLKQTSSRCRAFSNREIHPEREIECKRSHNKNADKLVRKRTSISTFVSLKVRYIPRWFAECPQIR